MQTLTIKGDLPKTIAAYNAGKLLAQKKIGDGGCFYDGGHIGHPDCGCAIGVMLTRETLAVINERSINQSRLLTLEAYRVVGVSGPEASALDSVQQRHDRWSRTGSSHDEAVFREYLAMLHREHGLTCPPPKALPPREPASGASL